MTVNNSIRVIITLQESTWRQLAVGMTVWQLKERLRSSHGGTNADLTGVVTRGTQGLKAGGLSLNTFRWACSVMRSALHAAPRSLI